MNRVVLGLGANTPGLWGEPEESLSTALRLLSRGPVPLDIVSQLYETRPVSSVRQPNYLNLVAAGRTRLPPAGLLRVLKQLERAAGRRLGVWSGPRPLDIDIIDYAGRRIGRSTSRRRSGLVLPHPEAHRRAFVLVPLAGMLPHWRHPGLGQTAAMLLARLPRKGREVRPLGRAADSRHGERTLDSRLRVCQ
jgi:2-amino-4-hydroxy-6-hydroxymethyldihydropteridine diphosphokinase